MLIQLAAQEAAAAAGEAAGGEKFGMRAMLEEGGALTWGVFIILVVMGELYSLFAKLW